MTPTAIALAGYGLWTMALVVGIAGLRTAIVMTRGRGAGGFRPDGSDVSPLAERLSRAHANCYESFPWLGGPMIVALATGATVLTDGLAPVALAARVAQSVTHLISTGEAAVLVRFGVFLVQVGIAGYWLVALLAGAGG